MTSPTLAFSKNFSLGQRARAMARYAAAVRLLQADPANIARIHGTMAGGMVRYRLLTNTTPRRLTPFALEWIAAYKGKVASVDEVTAWCQPPSPKPVKAPSILATMADHPELWLFIHRPALDKLRPTPFWLLTWLGAHRDTRPVDAIASAVGWSAEAVSIALRAIRDAGYTVDIVGESAAD